MADHADVATETTALMMNASLDAVQNGGDEEAPEFNEDGERICIDCGVVIPSRRVEAVNAVRCVDCQEYDEKLRSMHA